ncbi:hypothetical protein EDEG_03548 [Edhazardia aedis USNM 41457]|uniref:Uncharacterized protein n=1 Tax=Edhazardia aedis (strain USNM 41457) TaxID=1003232 RepID=J8ZQK5_EDHAE|nr:hypothetical protein EDEG_03548 [Edhazardia aedis USNM 41457]|eukprot:EJW01993.1 hypothetical protein EDEG_03548 [Edhazardia aedis USNM 41457]
MNRNFSVFFISMYLNLYVPTAHNSDTNQEDIQHVNSNQNRMTQEDDQITHESTQKRSCEEVRTEINPCEASKTIEIKIQNLIDKVIDKNFNSQKQTVNSEDESITDNSNISANQT